MKRRDFITGGHTELADALLEDLPSEAPPVASMGSLYTYSAQTGIWSALSPAKVSQHVQGYARHHSTVIGSGDQKPTLLKLRHSDVKGAIACALDTADHPTFFDDAAAGFAFRNGFVRVSSAGHDIGAHAPEHRARFAYSFDYKPGSPVKRWNRFLLDLFRDDHDAGSKVAVIQEFMGMSLMGLATKFQIALLLRGEGSNGKSSLLSIVRRCFPPGSVCAIEPQLWAREEYLAKIAGSIVNIVPELPAGEIVGNHVFKCVIDGLSQVRARRLYQDPFDFLPKAGHIFSVNEAFSVSDHSEGFWRRWEVIQFNRAFEAHERNPNIDEEIAAAELPAIVAWAIDGAVRALRQGRYTTVPSSTIAKAQWRRESDPVRTFLAEKTKPATQPDLFVQSSVLFDTFKLWAAHRNFKPMTTTSFSRRVARILAKARRADANYWPVSLLSLGETPPMLPEEDIERECIQCESAGLN